jgi:tetratricopeptide (TPR) repeat protein
LDRRDAAERMDRLTDSLAIGVLRELGEQFPRGAVPGSGLSASSIEPLKYFLRGEQFFRRTRWDSARVYYEKAVVRDTAFALAYRRLGAVVAWERVNWDSLASVYLLRAGTLNHGLPPRDSLLIRADSLTAAANATDDPLTSWTIVRELFRTLRGATERYPGDPEAWFALGEAGYHFGTGPVVSVPAETVLKAFDRALALDSAFAPAYLHPIELALDGEGRDLGLRYARAYLALNPQDVAHRGVRLVERLLTLGTGSPEARALLDSAPADVLVSARTRLRRWTDTAETAVMLSRLLHSGRQTDYALFADSSLMRRRLAEQLAYRGHVQEAYSVLGDQKLGLFVDLAHLDAVPTEKARATFARWLAEGSDYARLVLPWWSARGDSVALAEFLQQARLRLRSASEPSEQTTAEYDTAAAQAHLAVLRGDTTEALRRFTVLPDSACIRCYFDRLIRARLLSAASRHREASLILRERLVPFLTPIEIVFALERSRVAERLGDHREAAEASRLVAQAWHRADPRLQILAGEARARARRMGRDVP